MMTAEEYEELSRLAHLALADQQDSNGTFRDCSDYIDSVTFNVLSAASKIAHTRMMYLKHPGFYDVNGNETDRYKRRHARA